MPFLYRKVRRRKIVWMYNEMKSISNLKCSNTFFSTHPPEQGKWEGSISALSKQNSY